MGISTYASNQIGMGDIGAEAGFNFGFGALLGKFEEDVPEYLKYSSKTLGWKNRYLQAGMGGVAEAAGFVRHTSAEIAGGARQFSFLGKDVWAGNLKRLYNQHAIAGPAPNPANLVASAKWSAQKTWSAAKGMKNAGVKLGDIVPKGSGGRILGAGLAVGMSAYNVYSGYKTGGFSGAGRAAVREAAGMAAYKIGATAASSLGIGAGTLGIAAVGLAAGYAGKVALDVGQAHYKGLKSAEFGTPFEDTSGMGATMRQRSLMAIQRSQINGRAALGNEAAILHNMFI
jgi:hypothetical protein